MSRLALGTPFPPPNQRCQSTEDNSRQWRRATSNHRHAPLTHCWTPDERNEASFMTAFLRHYHTTTTTGLQPLRYLYPGQRPRWGWEVSQLLTQSSGTVYQPLCELQLCPVWRSLDIWRPTCLADWQCVSGLFMTRSTNPLIIIIIIIQDNLC